MRQYQSMVATMGVDKESMACVEAFERGDIPGWVGAITDEMAETFVIVGPADECRKRVEEVWNVADSFCLCPPIGGLPPEEIMFYIGGGRPALLPLLVRWGGGAGGRLLR